MAFGSKGKGQALSPEEVRSDAAPAAREPEPDRSRESWGAWGPDQVAQPDPDKALADAIEATGPAQRGVRSGAAASARVNEMPDELRNPTARDIRVETHDTEDVRMATEPPRTGG